MRLLGGHRWYTSIPLLLWEEGKPNGSSKYFVTGKLLDAGVRVVTDVAECEKVIGEMVSGKYVLRAKKRLTGGKQGRLPGGGFKI